MNAPTPDITPSAVAIDYLTDAIETLLNARSALLELEQALEGAPDCPPAIPTAVHAAFHQTNGLGQRLIDARLAVRKIHTTLNPSNPRTW